MLRTLDARGCYFSCRKSSVLTEFLLSLANRLSSIDWLEAAGLLTGLLSVWWLIRQNALTWPAGIVYTIISLVIFWRVRLYADLSLHVLYLGLSVYGWYYWVHGRSASAGQTLPVTRAGRAALAMVLLLCTAATAVMGWLLARYTDAAVPYWDSATTCFSLGGLWLTARKKIESWHIWFFVDVLAGAIYIYKEIYLYSVLYLVYTGMAVAGFLSWRKSMPREKLA
jgi:nicotinamide mononucleotide transporter